MRENFGCLGLFVTLTSCMQNVTTAYPLPPLEEEVTLRAENGDTVLRSEFDIDVTARRIVGHLAWSDSCRRAIVARGRAREVSYDVPNRATAVAAAVAALGTGVASAGLFARLDAFSPESTCGAAPDGESSCSSPRDIATGLGVLLAGAAVVLATTSVATLHAKPALTSDNEVLGAPSPPHVLATGATCGSGPVEDLAVAVYSDETRVAQARTNANGDVLLPLPPGFRGPVTIVTDGVSWRYPVVWRGEVLATLNVAP